MLRSTRQTPKGHRMITSSEMPGTNQCKMRYAYWIREPSKNLLNERVVAYDIYILMYLSTAQLWVLLQNHPPTNKNSIRIYSKKHHPIFCILLADILCVDNHLELEPQSVREMFRTYLCNWEFPCNHIIQMKSLEAQNTFQYIKSISIKRYIIQHHLLTFHNRYT